ncbi:unnamed protein product [Nesidiocoris tenuis]|uniref:Kelch domain-containing protein 3 n=1 Tax=Nesidiocoris tenuis TaxID=355587 RepID=A0A6H5GI01_9HEMI|nr:unnamed protein product [Nesidiocoris tenuis]
MFVFAADLLIWKEIPRPRPNSAQYGKAPFQRYGHTAVAYGKNIFIWGGRNDTYACNQLFVFDTGRFYLQIPVHSSLPGCRGIKIRPFSAETWSWSQPQVSGVIPCSRDGHSACVIGNTMYIFGGYEEEFERYSQDVYALNLDTYCWNYIVTQGQLPDCRDFHTSTAIGNRIYIFGGRSDPHNLDMDFYPNDIVYLDVDTRKWYWPVVSGPTPIGRRSHSAFLYNEKMYIFGGFNGHTKEHFNDLFCFCPKTHTWSKVDTTGEKPCRRRRQVCIVIGDQMFLFCGTR